MSRALVLGGGGPVGIGWQAGLLTGLREGGVDVADADLIVGTSAGSVVGAAIAAGRDPREALAVDEAPAAPGEAAGQGNEAGLQEFMSIIAEAAGNPQAAEALRARLGTLALQSPTIPEAQWLDLFAAFSDLPWPDGYACTAVDTATGAFKVWRADDDVPLQAAIASSCAVPAVFPPVTIGTSRYMDGGARDILNTDIAAGHDTVLAVSCTLIELPPGLAPPAMEALFAVTRNQLDGLRDGGSKVEVIVPAAEMLEISGYGMHLMDFSRASAAYDAGLRQAADEAARIGGAWG